MKILVCPFSEEPGPRPMTSREPPFSTLSLEEEEEEEDEEGGEDSMEPEGLCSEEHPVPSFSREAQRLREQGCC